MTLRGIVRTVPPDNVFEMLEVPEPEEMARRCDLGMALRQVIRDDGLSHRDLVTRLALPQPLVSRLLDGHFDEFTSAELEAFLATVGYRVRLVQATPTGTAAGSPP